MKERSVILPTNDVRSILAGHKTQFRKVVKHIPSLFLTGNSVPIRNSGGERWALADYGEGVTWFPCPYGVPGTRLYIRENWQHINGRTIVAYGDDPPTSIVVYEADQHPKKPFWPWRSSATMPKWAARIWLEVVDINVERLNTISDDDILAEGFQGADPNCVLCPLGVCSMHQPAAAAFRQAWEAANPKNLWRTNPWVWVTTFKMVEP